MKKKFGPQEKVEMMPLRQSLLNDIAGLGAWIIVDSIRDKKINYTFWIFK